MKASRIGKVNVINNSISLRISGSAASYSKRTCYLTFPSLSGTQPEKKS